MTVWKVDFDDLQDDDRSRTRYYATQELAVQAASSWAGHITIMEINVETE